MVEVMRRSFKKSMSGRRGKRGGERRERNELVEVRDSGCFFGGLKEEDDEEGRCGGGTEDEWLGEFFFLCGGEGGGKGWREGLVQGNVKPHSFMRIRLAQANVDGTSVLHDVVIRIAHKGTQTKCSHSSRTQTPHSKTRWTRENADRDANTS